MESEVYWNEIQRRVCANCVDSDGHGNCRLSGEQECGLKLYFPRIVETVLGVQGDKIEPYIQALRQNVCTYCKHQSQEGMCLFRTHADCGLDRYFPLVVEAIEDVQSEKEETTDAFGD